MSAPPEAYSSLGSRLVFTLAVLAWLGLSAGLWRRSERGAAARRAAGETEGAAAASGKLPLVYLATGASAVAEVWLVSEGLLPAHLAVGLLLIGVAASLRGADWVARSATWTLRSFGPVAPARLGPLEVRDAERWARRAELVGVPLLHGAVIGALVGWILVSGWERGRQRSLESESEAGSGSRTPG